MWQQQEEDENFYEGEIRYTNDRSVGYKNRPLPEPSKATHQTPASPPPTTKSGGNEQSRGNTQSPEPKTSSPSGVARKWSMAAVALAVVSILMLTAVLAMLGLNPTQMQANTSSSVESNSAASTGEATAKSCMDLKNLGITTSGVYTIKPEEKYQPIEAFCDMESDGGGWTLVASIHEDDITKKCDTNDRWSTYVPPYIPGNSWSIGKTNWENKRVFGDVRRCADDDYKNSAYYSLNSHNVMVWHIPSRTPTNTMRTRSTLRYRTTNNFLQTVGGNLQSLFDERYPIRRKYMQDTIGRKRTKLVLDALVANAASIRSQIPNWYTYGYESGDSYRIHDTRLFSSSYGNYIQFYSQRNGYAYLNYEKEYRFQWPPFVVTTRKSQPFIMATAISNEEGYSEFFRTIVHSNRKNSDTAESFENNITIGNFELQYRAVQHYFPFDPTYCVFHFILFNEKNWRSIRPSFRRTSPTSSGTYQYGNYRAEGTPSNFVMGYLLLTRTARNKFIYTHLDDVANVILQTFSSSHSLSDLFSENVNTDELSVPVTFDRGDADEVLKTVPPDLTSQVEPGYLQFRPFNLTGFPSAICPGVKVTAYRPEYVCIGGLSEDLGDTYGTCGDFAGWAGKKGDVISEEPKGSAHSRSDISSAILIFYR